MQWKKTITMVEAHAEGEVGRIVTSGVNDIPGDTMLEKMNYINQVDDSLRRFWYLSPEVMRKCQPILFLIQLTKMLI